MDKSRKEKSFSHPQRLRSGPRQESPRRKMNEWPEEEDLDFEDEFEDDIEPARIGRKRKDLDLFD